MVFGWSFQIQIKFQKLKKSFKTHLKPSLPLSFPAQLNSPSLSTQRAAHLPFLSPPPAHSTSLSLFFF
jgi:hypothetical protein